MPVKARAAIAFAPGEPLRICEVEVADPGPGQVMVRLLASGLCQSDLHAIDGIIAHDFPVILGHEGIGDVVRVGAGVTGFAPGDRVMPYLMPDCGKCPNCLSGRTNLCVEYGARFNSPNSPFSLDGVAIRQFLALGTFAEVTVVAADSLVKINPAASPEQACSIGCGVATGLGSALLRAKITPGSSVAVFGMGGVGLSTVQGARMAGAARIIAIDTNPAREALARQCGATHFLNPQAVDDMIATLIGLSGSFGLDFAFDCVGKPELAELALEAVHPAWGVAMCVGVMPPDARIPARPSALLSGRTLTGSFMGGAKRGDLPGFVDLCVSGELAMDAIVSHQLALEDINRGFAMMRSGEAVRSVISYRG